MERFPTPTSNIKNEFKKLKDMKQFKKLLQITKKNKNQKIFIRQNKKWVKFLCKSNNKI